MYKTLPLRKKKKAVSKKGKERARGTAALNTFLFFLAKVTDGFFAVSLKGFSLLLLFCCV